GGPGAAPIAPSAPSAAAPVRGEPSALAPAEPGPGDWSVTSPELLEPEDVLDIVDDGEDGAPVQLDERPSPEPEGWSVHAPDLMSSGAVANPFGVDQPDVARGPRAGAPRSVEPLELALDDEESGAEILHSSHAMLFDTGAAFAHADGLELDDRRVGGEGFEVVSRADALHLDLPSGIDVASDDDGRAADTSALAMAPAFDFLHVATEANTGGASAAGLLGFAGVNAALDLIEDVKRLKTGEVDLRAIGLDPPSAERAIAPSAERAIALSGERAIAPSAERVIAPSAEHAVTSSSERAIASRVEPAITSRAGVAVPGAAFVEAPPSRVDAVTSWDAALDDVIVEEPTDEAEASAGIEAPASIAAATGISPDGGVSRAGPPPLLSFPPPADGAAPSSAPDIGRLALDLLRSLTNDLGPPAGASKPRE
ncbi:hypothetical protein L6R52_35205, partial [Myxococcota bacterium]|nr:hypothetical protein [Myxococcota bacterium]